MIKTRIDQIYGCVNDIVTTHTTDSIVCTGIEILSDFFGIKNGTYVTFSKDIGMDTELALRSYLANSVLATPTTTISSNRDNNIAKIHKLQNIEKLLLLSIRFALTYGSIRDSAAVPIVDLSNLYKIPFLLIEDVLESESIAFIEGESEEGLGVVCSGGENDSDNDSGNSNNRSSSSNANNSFWYLLEHRFIDSLTTPELFAKGKLIILRACNALLRRLSKTSNTELCGRVHMFLAALYPLSEKSAMNLSGKVNTASCVHYETLKEFQQQGQQGQQGQESEAEVEGGGPGGDNLEGVEAVAEAVLPAAVTEAEVEGVLNRHGVKYSTYKAFWGLQNCLYTDLKPTPASLSTLGQGNNMMESLTRFVTHAEAVCGCFEQVRFSKSDVYADACSLQYRIKDALMTAAVASKETVGLKTTRSDSVGSVSVTAKSNNSANHKSNSASGAILGTTGATGTGGNLNLKYLVSSELFHLELRDVSFRLQICTQILVFLYSLKVRRPVITTTTVTMAMPGVPGGAEDGMIDLSRYYDFQMIGGSGGDIDYSVGTTAAVGMTLDSNKGNKDNKSKSDLLVQSLHDIECRVFHILETCTGNGLDYARLLYDTLVRHERQWILWKKGACPSNERVAGTDTDTDTVVTGGDNASCKNKRSLGEFLNDGNSDSCGVAGSPRGTENKKAKEYAFAHLHSNTDIIGIANRLVSRVPTFTEILEQYKDAEDPDAGIDDEYHPKHDPVYCWRARRLMVARGHRLDLMRQMSDGDLTGAVLTLYPELAVAVAEAAAARAAEQARVELEEAEERERAEAMEVAERENEEEWSGHPLQESLAECVEDEDEREREKETALSSAAAAADVDVEFVHPLRDFVESVEDDDEEAQERERAMSACSDSENIQSTHPLRDFAEAAETETEGLKGLGSPL